MTLAAAVPAHAVADADLEAFKGLAGKWPIQSGDKQLSVIYRVAIQTSKILPF